jgi:hypothetical protein
MTWLTISDLSSLPEVNLSKSSIYRLIHQFPTEFRVRKIHGCVFQVELNSFLRFLKQFENHPKYFSQFKKLNQIKIIS